MSRTTEAMLPEYIERLTKRRDYLSVRIEKGSMAGRDLSYDKAEFAALDFTIAFILDNQAMALDFMDEWLDGKLDK